MRFSLASSALCGAVTVLAVAVPRAPHEIFEVLSLDEIATGTIEEVSQLFEAGAFNDDRIITTASAGSCTNPAIRPEWRNYSASDRAAFMSAIKCLIDMPSGNPSNFPGSKNRYEDLVSSHQVMTETIHHAPQFLPWHRYYVAIFESMLREECGFDRPLPWWDETLDAGRFGASDLFTDAYYGDLPPRATSNPLSGTCITDGTFANITLHIGRGPTNTDHCLARGVWESDTARITTKAVSDCNSRTDYDEMRSCQEGSVHAWGHNAIGTVMSDPYSSPSDPIFFMHHGFIDRNWKVWQNADPARLETIDGCASSDNGCEEITLDYVLGSQGLRPATTVREVLDTMGGYLCYRYDY